MRPFHATLLAALCLAGLLQAEPLPLSVLQKSPAGQTDSLEAGSEIEVTFSQNMVELSGNSDMGEFCPIQITPALKGRCRWKGTNTLVYELAEAVKPARHYEVKIPKGTRSKISGAELGEDVSWSFETLRPNLQNSMPAHGEKWVDLKPRLFLQFNLTVTAQDAAGHIFLEEDELDSQEPDLDAAHPSDGLASKFAKRARKLARRLRGGESVDEGQAPDDKKLVELQASAISAKDYEELRKNEGLRHYQSWIYPDGKQLLELRPARALKPNHAYRLWVMKGLKPQGADVGLESTRVISFETWYTFRYIGNREQRSCGADSPQMRFSNPIDMGDLLSHLKITPKIEMPKAEDFRSYQIGTVGEGRERWIEYYGMRLQPATPYHFHIDASATDVFGNRLGKDIDFAWTTPDFCPSFNMPGGFGVLESYLAPRHPVDVTNMESLALELRVIPEDLFVPFYRFYERAYDYDEEGATSRSQKPDLAALISRAWKPPVKRNVSTHSFVDLGEALKLKKGSLLETRLDWNLDGQDHHGESLDNLTAVGLTLKTGPDSTLIWSTDLKSGKAKGGVKVELRLGDNSVKWSGKTDAKGVAEAPGWRQLGIHDWKRWPRPEIFAIAYDDSGSAILGSNLHGGIEAWRFNISTEDSPEARQRRGLVFSDRGVYRPGETVYVKGILRDLRKGDWALSMGEELKISVKDSREQEVLTRTAKVSPYGSFDFSFETSKDSATGWWNISIRGEQMELSQGVRVEAVKPAAFEVRLHASKPSFLAGENFESGVEGWYLFGAPMSGAQADWNLVYEPTVFQPEGWEDFSFAPGWWERRANSPQSGGSGSLTLDAQGAAKLSAQTKGEGFNGPFQARLEVSVTAPDRQKLFGRSSSVVHKAWAYPGIHSLGTYFQEMGKEWKAQLVVVDPAGKALSGLKIEGKVLRREHLSVRKTGVSGRLEWHSETKDSSVQDFSLDSADKAIPWSFTPDKPGEYYVTLHAKDSAGRTNEAATMFYVTGKGEAWWQREDQDIIQMIADKKAYKPGDTARIMIQSPFEHATALITVERETVMDSRVVELEGGAQMVEIPIKESYLPNAYVGVVISEGRASDAKYDAEGLDLAKPQAKFGYLNLAVEPGGRRLKVAVSSDKRDYRPGAAIKAEVSVLGEDGTGAQAEVTLYAVDEGILALTGYQTPDPFAEFYGSRPLQIGTADSRLVVIGQRSFGEKGKERGGGGAAAALEGVDLRSNFKTLAYWNAGVITGKDGKASVSFSLPDNLTAFRLMAVAHEGRRFGSGEARIRVNKPLMLRPSLPRFARLGDKFQGGVTLHNTSPDEMKVTLELKGEGEAVKALGEARRELVLKAGAAIEQLWDLEAKSLGTASFEFRAAAGAESDGLKWSLPVTVPEKMETVATSSVTQSDSEEGLRLPSNAVKGQGKLEATLSSSALSGLKDSVKYVFFYPHGCLEQRMSRSMPIICGADLIETFGLGDLASLKKTVQQVFDELPHFQHGSGGYMYWTWSVLPDPYITAYALDLAYLAKKEGYQVPEESVKRAVQWLLTSLGSNQQWAYPYSEDETYASRAYGLYVLAEYGENPGGYLTNLYVKRSQLPFIAKANLYKAADKLGGNEAMVATLAQELLNQAKVDPRGLHFEEPQATRMDWVHYSTELASAQILQAFLQVKGGFANDEKAVAWLTQARKKDGAWSDTHSNAWALRAFQDYYRHYEKEAPNFTASLGLKGGKELWNQAFAGRSLETFAKTFSLADLFSDGESARLDFKKQGPGRLYYSMAMSSMPARFDKPAFEGFEIERSLKPLKGTAGPIKAGDRYIVTLKVKTRQDRTFVAMTDPLPAGFEVVDSSFATEGKRDEEKLDDEAKNDRGDWWGGFSHAENYDDRVQVYADFLSSGEHVWRYLVQATSPGKFSQPSAWVEQMYEPEIFGRTAGAEVGVEK